VILFGADEGEIYSFGKNNFGQLGLGHFDETRSMIGKVDPVWSNKGRQQFVVQIAAGMHTSMLMTSESISQNPTKVLCIGYKLSQTAQYGMIKCNELLCPLRVLSKPDVCTALPEFSVILREYF
jgi:alpha-tubulin suppressor-like RCC1 family protein